MEPHYIFSETKHTKTGEPIWCLQVNKVLTKQQYRGLTNDIRSQLNGKYSRFLGCKVFFQKPNMQTLTSIMAKYGVTNNEGAEEILSKGGELVGASHAEGGIKVNVTGGNPIEVESDEVILTAPAMRDKKKIRARGICTKKNLASAINQSGGGVDFSDPKGGKCD